MSINQELNCGPSPELGRLKEELEQTRWHLQRSQQIAGVGSWQLIIKDSNTVVPGSHQWSDEAFRLLGYEPGEVEVSNALFNSHLHPEDVPLVEAALNHSTANCAPYDIEHRLIRKDGTEILVHDRGDCEYYDDSRKWIKMVGTMQDITARRKGENYEASLKSIFDNTAIAYILLDARMNIVAFNQAAYANAVRLLELKLQVGKSMLLYVVPELRDSVALQHASVIAGQTYCYDQVFHRRVGRDLWGRVSLFPIHLNRTKVMGMAISIEDITEHKRSEEELRQKNSELHKLMDQLSTVREEERTAIAREIHDELGQQLSTLKMGVHRVQNKLQEHRLSDDITTSLLGEIEQAIKSVRRIATNLRPIILDYEGLEAALKWYASEFEKLHSIPCKLKVSLPVEIEDRKIAITLFRVLQESFTNIIRHARAGHIEVNITMQDGFIRLTIADDGVGIDMDAIRHKRTFGLISMQERLAVVGGRYSISRNGSGGTTTEVIVPYPYDGQKR